MIPYRERESLQAELAELERLITRTSQELARIGFESRRDELQARLRDLEARQGRVASAALLFHGAPVFGSAGVEADFGGEALEHFQGIVSRVAAARSRERLGARGPVPDEGSSRLLITGTTRGSFGFILEELADVPLFGPTPLAEAVEETGRLLEAATDDEKFGDAVEEADGRVLTALSEFFKIMNDRKATLRVQVGDVEIPIDTAEQVRAAYERTATLKEQDDQPIRGTLRGVLPDTRRFEFRRADTGAILTGRIAKAYPDPERLKHEFVDKDILAHMRVMTFRRPSGKENSRYELQAVTMPPGDDRPGEDT